LGIGTVISFLTTGFFVGKFVRIMETLGNTYKGKFKAADKDGINIERK